MTDRETVRAGYDALGNTYADHRSVGPTERDFIERLLADDPSSPRVLDAGCGPGPTLPALAQHGRAVGMDGSSEQLDIAAETASDAALVRGDIAALPFGDDRFDAAVSLGVLMHLPNDEQADAIAEFSRVLRPGGRLVISDGTGKWSGEHDDWLGDGVTMSWEITGIDAVASDLAAAGFELLARTETSDELADDDDASQGLALAELVA